MIDIDEYVELVAAALPPLSEDQRAKLSAIFASGPAERSAAA